LRGLDLFAQYRIREGMALCIEVMGINQWGKNARIPVALDALEVYGGAAKAVLPELRELEKGIRAHREKAMAKHAERVAGMIKRLEAAPEDVRPLRSLDLPKSVKGPLSPGAVKGVKPSGEGVTPSVKE